MKNITGEYVHNSSLSTTLNFKIFFTNWIRYQFNAIKGVTQFDEDCSIITRNSEYVNSCERDYYILTRCFLVLLKALFYK